MTRHQYKAKRTAAGLSQHALADILGVTRETVNRRESGEQPITHETALALDAALEAQAKHGGKKGKK